MNEEEKHGDTENTENAKNAGNAESAEAQKINSEKAEMNQAPPPIEEIEAAPVAEKTEEVAADSVEQKEEVLPAEEEPAEAKVEEVKKEEKEEEEVTIEPAAEKAEEVKAEPVEKSYEEILAVEKKEEEPAAEERRWYIVQTLTGYEERVKRAIERSIANANLQNRIFNVLIPEEDVVEIRNNRRTEKMRKMYPGYIFVEMMLSEETWYTIRQTPGVARFIGSKVKPVPVSDREMQRVLKQLGVKEEMVEVEFEVGEAIRVISGPFRGYAGSVNEINVGKNKIKVLINIFGRDTPVEIDFDQAEKIV